MQNAWVDGITSQSSTYEEWSEFVQTLQIQMLMCTNPVLMCKLMKLSQIFKTIFALLMFKIKTEKKTLKAYVSCQNIIFIR